MDQLSLFKKILLLGGTLVLCVAVVFLALQLAVYLIDDVFHIEGWLRTTLQFVAIIISLYPMKFVFGTVLYRVSEKS